MIEYNDRDTNEASTQSDRLEYFRQKIVAALETARDLVRQRIEGLEILDFDIRGKLYELALALSPNAREDESGTLIEMMDLQGNENCVDIAAGTGLLTKKVVEHSQGNIYAIDPSGEQLQVLQRDLPSVQIIRGFPDSPDIRQYIPEESIDIVTSQGGIHHVGNQRAMFENIAMMLSPNGKCICADVCADSSLSRHFDEFVSQKCLTGHTAQWLSEDRLKELIEGLPLQIKTMERKTISWVFESRAEIALFFKGLHAYDLPESEVLEDLEDALGIVERDGKYYLNWPLLFFHLQKEI